MREVEERGHFNLLNYLTHTSYRVGLHRKFTHPTVIKFGEARQSPLACYETNS